MNKIASMKEAIQSYVVDGESIYITGFTHLIGFAAAHEIIRQERRDLTLIRLTPDLVYDQMIAAGVARHLIFSYLGNPGLGSLYCIRQAIETPAISWEEYTHGSLIAALRAGASGVPFSVIPAMRESDLETRNSQVRQVVSPFDGRKVTVVSPVTPKVTIVHAQRADKSGNTQVWGGVGDIREAAFASESLIVSAEEIVSESVIRSDPARTIIPGFAVDAVVHEPWGAHPSFAQGFYARDNRFYREWVLVSQSASRTESYLAEYVYGVRNRREYAQKMADRMEELSLIGENLSEPVNYGRNSEMSQVQE